MRNPRRRRWSLACWLPERARPWWIVPRRRVARRHILRRSSANVGTCDRGGPQFQRTQERARPVTPTAASQCRVPLRRSDCFGCAYAVERRVRAPRRAMHRNRDVAGASRDQVATEPTDPARMAAIQLQMLDNAAALVRPGGAIVYSVCSIAPEEGENVVDGFLASHSDFAIDGGMAVRDQFEQRPSRCRRIFYENAARCRRPRRILCRAIDSALGFWLIAAHARGPSLHTLRTGRRLMIAGAARASSDSNPNHLGPITWTPRVHGLRPRHHARRMFVAELYARAAACTDLLRAVTAPELQNVAHRGRFLVWPRLRGTPHQHGRGLQSGGAYCSVQDSAAGLPRESNEPGDRQVGSGPNQRSGTVRARALVGPLAWRGAANRADRQGSRQGASDAHRRQHAGPEFRYIDVCRKLRHHHVAPRELCLVPAADIRRGQTPPLSLHFVAPNCLKSYRRMALERSSALLNPARSIRN